jgi:hypothetical protein
VIDRIAEEKDILKGDSLEYVIDKYNQLSTKGEVDHEDYIAPTIIETMKDIDCDYIQYLDDTFYCLERFENRRKKDALGVEPEEVKILCTACKRRKAEQIQEQWEKEQRKQSIKKLKNFAKQFMIMTERGFIAASYMCIADSIDGNFQISRDGKTLTCALDDYNPVNIEETCKCRLNPKTKQPPCINLVTLEHLVTLTKDDLQEMNLELPQLEASPIQPQEQLEPDLDRKTVEANYEIKEETNNG